MTVLKAEATCMYENLEDPGGIPCECQRCSDLHELSWQTFGILIKINTFPKLYSSRTQSKVSGFGKLHCGEGSPCVLTRHRVSRKSRSIALFICVKNGGF